MRVKEEFTEAQRRFGLLSFYDKFEHIVILILTVLIAVFIVFAIWNLALKIFLSIASSTFDPTDYTVFQAVFGMIFSVNRGIRSKKAVKDRRRRLWHGCLF
jgi:membrane associated rhomboid family serine protease